MDNEPDEGGDLPSETFDINSDDMASVTAAMYGAGETLAESEPVAIETIAEPSTPLATTPEPAPLPVTPTRKKPGPKPKETIVAKKKDDVVLDNEETLDTSPDSSISPFTIPLKQDETVPGGRYIRGARVVNGKAYGGVVGDCDGNVLAVFEDNQLNTG